MQPRGMVRPPWAGAAAVMLAAGVMATAAAGWAQYHASYPVETAAITVNGTSIRVLTDASGKTFYYLATDKPVQSTCTGTCAVVWPPFVSDTVPAAEGPLPGKLALVKTANGSQVSYNGHLLYTYSGDSAPHQANGQGVAGKWWVARVDLKPAMMGAAPTPGTDKGDYGRGGY